VALWKAPAPAKPPTKPRTQKQEGWKVRKATLEELVYPGKPKGTHFFPGEWNAL
jgi:hypothetical protein